MNESVAQVNSWEANKLACCADDCPRRTAWLLKEAVVWYYKKGMRRDGASRNLPDIRDKTWCKRSKMASRNLCFCSCWQHSDKQRFGVERFDRWISRQLWKNTDIKYWKQTVSTCREKWLLKNKVSQPKLRRWVVFFHRSWKTKPLTCCSSSGQSKLKDHSL